MKDLFKRILMFDSIVVRSSMGFSVHFFLGILGFLCLQLLQNTFGLSFRNRLGFSRSLSSKPGLGLATVG